MDIGTPTNSPFQLGGDISGTIQNSINQVTGKLAFSIPLASVTSGTVSYALNLGYDGSSSFKMAKEQNKYNPTSVVGVGWSLPISKIVVDNKQTTTRDDDTFYIIDGATNSKLICVDKLPTLYTFQLEKYANWKITYSTTFDSWTIIKDDGKTYSFGQGSSGNSREYMSVWGNWIGDSNQNPNGQSTIVWNLSEIGDQWNNFIKFNYELVEGRQNLSQVMYKHTEASYLKEIISSKGAKIKLYYGEKGFDEYYEPHREKDEPDAYQERYEKKYLENVEIFNNNNEIVTSYNLGTTLNDSNSLNNKKRYLINITQSIHNNGQISTMPSQIFEYHTSGTFMGGLKKINYPSGGSVTYNYNYKLLFNNGADKFKTPFLSVAGYVFHSVLVKDNYILYVRRSSTPITGDKYRYKFFRFWWNGEQWESNEYTFPHLMNTNMDGFASVLKEDFYGFMFDTGQHADLYMFHKNKDGQSWKFDQSSSMYIGDGPPTLMAGNNFIALGRHHTGRIDGFVWNGSGWSAGLPLNQGVGQYYYAATNNFILSLNEDGGPDMLTGGNYNDNYYIHYLDAENKWQRKSWSAFAQPRINGIENPSHFYPGNSISGFVADDNPELFLRWDSNYNLIAIDNDVLGSYNDLNYIVPVNSSMFTIIYYWDKGPLKSARFNGVNWSVTDFPMYNKQRANFGLDFITYKNDDSNQIMLKEYSPNTHSWGNKNLNYFPWYTSPQVHGINSEFFFARNKILKKTALGVPYYPIIEIGTLEFDNGFTYSDGLSHSYVKEVQYTSDGGLASSEFKKGTYFYINKETGSLSSINLGLKDYLKGNIKLGGYTPFMSPKAMWVKSIGTGNNINTHLYRIIDDKFNESITDIVIGSISLNDDNGNIRKISYNYYSPNSSSDNDVTFYGEVVVENKGFGTSSIGKIKKIFNTGTEDVQMTGLQLEEQILDVNNNLKRKTTNTWKKYIKTAHNGSFQVDLSHYIGLESKKEELFFNTYSIENLTNFSYNSKGQLSSTNKTNSKGQTERQNIRYAHEQYNFMRDKNMLADTYETTTFLDNEVVNVKRNIWTNTNDHTYIKEKFSGPSISQLRLNSEITNVDNLGNLLETSDGKNIFNSILKGYSNLYEVASIVNAKHQDVVNELDVTYDQLQNLSSSSLKIELMKLYDRLPNAMISLTFYDDNGRVINRVNERKEETFIYYDDYGRLDYVTDGYGKVLEKKEYNFGN